MSNKRNWNRSNFIKFLKSYGIDNFAKNFSEFKNKKIALIGTSPITLIVANIYALFDAKITIFEDKEIGGAWKTIKYKKNYYPSSTHILMPNIIASDLLNLLNIPNSNWSKQPYSINIKSKKKDLFPRNKKKYDQFIMNDFSYGNKDIVSYLLRKLKLKKTFKFYKKKVSKITESKNNIKVYTNKINYEFDYVFFTPAANLNRIEILAEKIYPKYNNYPNKSILMILPKDFNFGSSFVHFFGKSPIREIQSFKDKYKKNIIILKLSRQWKNNNLQKVYNTMNNIFKNYNFLSDAIKIKINYNMKRMTPETQKLILTKSKRILFPLTGINMSNKTMNAISQDIARLIGRKKFFYSLIKVNNKIK